MRFLSNASSGRMGCAVASAALARGHQVVLVCGPLEVSPPPCDVRRVVSTRDMLAACRAALADVDAVVMAAAPADFRPARRVKGKIKKTAAPPTLRLTRTPDILTDLARRRTAQVLVGFALEARDLVENARGKLKAKGLDLIVANAPSAIAAESSTVHILRPDGADEVLDHSPKERTAERIVEIIEQLVADRERH